MLLPHEREKIAQSINALKSVKGIVSVEFNISREDGTKIIITYYLTVGSVWVEDANNNKRATSTRYNSVEEFEGE